jgi:hypothetical protein
VHILLHNRDSIQMCHSLKLGYVPQITDLRE